MRRAGPAAPAWSCPRPAAPPAPGADAPAATGGSPAAAARWGMWVGVAARGQDTCASRGIRRTTSAGAASAALGRSASTNPGYPWRLKPFLQEKGQPAARTRRHREGGAGWRPRPWLSASARRERDAVVVQLAGEAHQWRARDVGQLAFAVAGQRDHAHAVDVPVVAADATAEAGDQAEFGEVLQRHRARQGDAHGLVVVAKPAPAAVDVALLHRDRKSTLLNSSHVKR